MAVAQAFIEEIVNPANAQELFKYTGKILENNEVKASFEAMMSSF